MGVRESHAHRKLAAMLELYGLEAAWIGAVDSKPGTDWFWTDFNNSACEQNERKLEISKRKINERKPN